MAETQKPLTSSYYNQAWQEWDDFIKFNPGARHRRRLVKKILSPLHFESVLDVGCGNGELLSIMASIYPQAKLNGTDLSDFVISKNQKYYPQVDFKTLDIQKDKLSESYDLVICSEVIEHIEDQKSTFRNLAEMVKSGGHLLLTCPTGHMYETEKKFGHVHHPTIPELLEYANSNGLICEKTINWGWPIYKITKYLTNINSEWALKNFANGAYSPFSKFVSSVLFYLNFTNVPSTKGCQLFLLFKKL